MTEPDKTETATATDNSATVTTTTKPGYKTTEFYLSLLATLLTALFASGVFTSSTSLAIAGMAATVLTALGYKVTRAMVKMAGLVLLVGLATSSQLGCSTLRDSGTRVAGDVVDCMKPDAKAAISELAPAFRDIVKNATGNNGRVDWAPVRAAAAPLKSAATRCAFTAVIAEVLRPRQGPGQSPQSSPLEADQVDVLTGFRAIQADLFGGATFKLADGTL